jgi:amidase
MMGSLRNPAAYSNVTGFRSSQGGILRKDKNMFFQQLGYEVPLGRNLEDTRRLLATMSGYDSRFPLSLRDTVSATAKPLKLKDTKIGWIRDYNGYLTTERGILDLFAAALKSLSSQGLIIEECQPEYDMARLWQTWLTLRQWTIASSAKSLYDNPKLRAPLKPGAVWAIEGRLQQTGLDISRTAIAGGDWYKALHALFERLDFLALPSAQVFPFAAQTHWPKQINDQKINTYHRLMEIVIGGTLSGCPVLNLPVGFDQQGRPMGMQFIAPTGEDYKLLDFPRGMKHKLHFYHRVQGYKQPNNVF